MICPICGLPKELCVCAEMVKERPKIRVYSDRRKYGKVVTVIDGLRGEEIGRIARELKQKLACGGTTKNDRIELQGDHVQRVKKVLKEIGFAEDMIEIT